MPINEDFAFCIEEFGLPTDGEQVPSEIIEMYRDKVPLSMLDFWHECGTGLWLQGRFQLCRPDRYQGLIDLVLDGDPDFPPEECTLIGFTAFGELHIWHKTHFFFSIDLVNKVAYGDHLDAKPSTLSADRVIASDLSSIDEPSFDFLEHTAKPKPLFDRALKKLGQLSFGECYGFFPAVGMGGLGVLSELRKVRALEHFAMIAQLEPIELRYNDLDAGKILRLRQLGPQG